MNHKINLFWFRQDLRLSDNPALLDATNSGDTMAIYILDDDNSNEFKLGSASKWWLHHSLHALNQSLNGKLNVYIGNSTQIVIKLLQKYPVTSLYWNQCYEPFQIKRDNEIKKYLDTQNISYKIFNGSLIWDPSKMLKSDGKPYQIYTPFYRNAYSKEPLTRNPLPAPKALCFVQDLNNTQTIDSLQLLSSNPWYKKFEPLWDIGESAAQKHLKHFLKHDLFGYKTNRDYPCKSNISKLSPHLHFGEISPIQVWHALKNELSNNACTKDIERFLSQLGWREFSYYLLCHFPDLPTKNLQKKFDHFLWEFNSQWLRAWQKGETGYPIVDAGMRELWQTGYMHNRVRMIVGSFLVKNLRLHWHHGENWFWNCLLDADLANNSASWQWVAGCGTDAAPYFRIFNPIIQGEKFDPDGTYTCRFLPELAKLPKQFLFKPWEAPETILKAAGITLGDNYPKPIVDLQESRNKALAAYHAITIR